MEEWKQWSSLLHTLFPVSYEAFFTAECSKTNPFNYLPSTSPYIIPNYFSITLRQKWYLIWIPTTTIAIILLRISLALVLPHDGLFQPQHNESKVIIHIINICCNWWVFLHVITILTAQRFLYTHTGSFCNTIIKA